MKPDALTSVMIFFLLAVILVSAVYFFYRPSMHRSDTLTIRGQEFVVERAVTPAQRYQGLSGRRPLADKTGMLFVFGLPGRPQFVMRNMLFPLDFIWMNNGEVVDLTTNVPIPSDPKTPLETYQPKVPTQYVLEVLAGTVERYGIKIGDRVEGLTK